MINITMIIIIAMMIITSIIIILIKIMIIMMTYLTLQGCLSSPQVHLPAKSEFFPPLLFAAPNIMTMIVTKIANQCIMDIDQ